jgi:ABC-2 type transport system permease protein
MNTASAAAAAPTADTAAASAARSGGFIHPGAIVAVWRRQVYSLLGNPLGYVFIFVFVLAAAAWLFWIRGGDFFKRDISDLGPLVSAMPWFLAVLLPALTMGAWASEREQGTEELLLTLPLSALDALIGKFLAVASYFTIALVCSLSNVVVLAWLGNPDPGLMFANYFGWWLAGLAFAALGILSSVLVSLPAVAFVAGAGLCLVAVGLATWTQWFDDFNRGVVPLFNVLVALGVIAGALGASTLMLASRRWRPGSSAMVWAQVLTLVFGIVLAVNVGRAAGRWGAYRDVSVEGLSSLSGTSLDLLKAIDQPVTITAFISKDLPAEMQLKGKEVEDKLKAVGRASGLVKIDIKHPADALDDDGAMATREFGLKPRKVPSDEVTGVEMKDVFLGAAVACGGNTQVIEHFDPGLSVEYELVRAVRGVAIPKKRVLGVAQTDLQITGGFDFQSGGMIPEWEIVKEWRHQYDVRPVNLDSDVAAEVEVLVVPQPSSLTQPQIEHLHDYIWSGRSALLLEDPVPVLDGKAELIPSRPKKSQNPYGGMGGQDESGPKKGDIKPLFKALGLDYDESQVVSSDYDPAHIFRGRLPGTFVWIDRTQTKGETDSGATAGISSLLMPFCGELKVASDKYSALSVTPLVRATPGAPWGRVPMSEVVHFDYMGRMDWEREQPRIRDVGDKMNPPILAVEITGHMAAAYPEVDPSAKPEPKPGEVGPPTPEKKAGVPSAKPIHVIVVADTDCFSPMFYQIYRNQDGQANNDQLRALADLRNVQFAGNAVDQLFNDKAFLDLRTRRPERRSLKRIDDSLLATQERVRQDTEKAMGDAEAQIERIRGDFQRELAKIDEREDLDENLKAQQKATATINGNRKVEVAINEINLERDHKLAEAKATQRRELEATENRVRWLAVGIPAVALLALVLAVFANRLASERAHIPASRKRSAT